MFVLLESVVGLDVSRFSCLPPLLLPVLVAFLDPPPPIPSGEHANYVGLGRGEI